jgi:hypothetical protein
MRFGSGKFRTTLNCAHCQDGKIEFPEFRELIVPVDDNENTLEEILYSDSSNREDDDVWRCSACNTVTQPIKTRRIQKHPRVLCILINRTHFIRETQTEIIQTTKLPFPIVNFDPNDGLDDDNEHPTYDLIGGIFHQPTTKNRGHYIAVCNINHDINKWITYDDKDFETNKFLHSRARTPTVKVDFYRQAYMLFYQRMENVSSTSDSESDHGGSQSEDEDRFSYDDNSEHNGDNVNDPNESSAPSHTNEPSSVTLHNDNNQTASTSSSQFAEENTNGHNNDSPSPQMCPTQRRQVPVVDLSNDADISDDEEHDANVADEDVAEVADEVEPNRNDICPMCWHTIESERDRACIDTDEKCVCGDLQYHSFCVRRHRNVCRDQNIPWKCGRHQNEIHRIMNMDGENIFENDENDVDICIICRDSLDTKSIWGRFVCSTCPHWYHNDCLVNYVNNKGSYHRDSCTARYDMTRLRCAVCRQSPRSIETL